MSSTPKFCSECGGPLEAGARFCGACGAKIPVSSEAKVDQQPEVKNTVPSPPPPPKRRKKVVIPPVQPQPEPPTEKASPSPEASAQFTGKIRALLAWSGVWGVSWLILGVIHGAIYQHLFFITGYGLPAIAGGLIAAVIIQTTGVSQQGPSLKMAGLIAGSWFLFGGFLLVFRDILHFLHIPLHYFSRSDLLLFGGVIAVVLAWKVLKQEAQEVRFTNLKSTQMMFLAGWTLCGILPMFLRGLISVAVFLFVVTAISVFIYKKRP